MNPSNVVDARYGNSTVASLAFIPAGQGSGAAVRDVNMQARSSGAASWKQHSPYSGSCGTFSSALAMAIAREPRGSVSGRVGDLAVEQVEEDQLVELRNGDVTRDARAAIALGVGEEIAKVDVGEPRSRQKNAAVWKMERSGRRHALAPRPYAAECCCSFASMNSRRTAPMI